MVQKRTFKNLRKKKANFPSSYIWFYNPKEMKEILKLGKKNKIPLRQKSFL